MFGVCLELGCWCLVLSALFLPGQAASNTSASASSRYLLVVETSRAMQPRAPGAQRAVRELLNTGMNGQLRRGDTLGVWTFNESLYTGKLPLQKWSPEIKDQITSSVTNFLAGQKNEKKADFKQVLPALDKVVTGSDYLTIILVTDGEQKITGTPFNGQINEFFQLWRDQQRKADMPFLTVLRASHGEITHYALNTAPWTVQMPPLAPEIQALVEADSRPAPPPKVQTSSVPPLIIHGKKPAVPAADTNTQALAGASNAPTASLATNAATVHVIEPYLNLTSKPTPTVIADSATNHIKITGQQPGEPPPPTKLGSNPSDTTTQNLAALPSSPLSASPSPPNTNSSTPPPTLAQPVAATAAEPASNRTVFLIAGLILVAGVSIFAVFRLRRSRSKQSVSIITRSIEREK